jgi:hypothetical protein
MGYCCAKGMKLAEFHTKAEFDEVVSNKIGLLYSMNESSQHKNPTVAASLNGGFWINISPTFNNGNKSDIWCQSGLVVPGEIMDQFAHVSDFSGARRILTIGRNPIALHRVYYTDLMDTFLCSY